MIVKGIVVLLIFTLIASLFQFDTILWLLSNSLTFGITAAIVIFQPELRRALEELGRKNLVASFLSFDNTESGEEFGEKTINEIAKAVTEMSKAKTGALIVIEQAVALGEYERTGIALDAKTSSQLLINIFEHNTPLHDGAIIVRGNRIVSATCYLPLSDNLKISKDLGTRHRAAIGMSEVSDAMIIIVSEETGHVSIAQRGQLARNVTPEYLRVRMNALQNKDVEVAKIKKIWKGWKKNEGSAD